MLVTTWTVTSARMLAKRLPEGAFHQYMPVDRVPYVQRFSNHWRPDFAVLIESEIWPNMLEGRCMRGTKNPDRAGSMAACRTDSFRRWRRFSGWAKGTDEQLCHVPDAKPKMTARASPPLAPIRCVVLGNL